MTGGAQDCSECVLVLFPDDRDAVLVRGIATQAGVRSERCDSLGELSTRIREGAGVAVLGQEALSEARAAELEAVIEAQPDWSDFPIIVVAAPGSGENPRGVLRATSGLGNVVVLERPLRAVSLTTALQAALRARRRQYEIRHSQQLLHDALERAERDREHLSIAQSAGAVGSFEWDLETGAWSWSDELQRILGLTPGKNECSLDLWKALVVPEDREATFGALDRALERTDEIGLEYRICRRDGLLRWCYSRAIVMRNEGRPVRLIGVTLDITERKRTEQMLRETEERFRLAADNFPDVFAIYDSELRLEYLNPAGIRRGGLEHRDWYRKRDEELHPAHVTELFVPHLRRALATKDAQELEVTANLTGEAFTVVVNYVPVLDEAGEVRQILGITRDITERKRMEDRLRQTQKTESIALLAGGIAHDFNNLLASIMGFASLLREEVPARCKSKLDVIVGASEKAADLTRQLLAYAGKGKFEIGPVDLSRCVHDIAELLETTIPKTVRFELSLAQDLPPVEADRGQIQQIVMNLALNAAEAIGEERAGSVTVLTRVLDITASDHFLDELTREEIPPGHYVALDVRDTGCGIDNATRAKMFEPFFTTKFTGRGLGMAAVAGVIKAHRGAVHLSTEVGQGTAFTVLLPPAAEGHKASVPAAVAKDLRGAGTVLAVEDDDMVRNFARQALERYGYQVLTASEGREAIELFKSRSGAIDVVLLDIVMPVMNGRETIEGLSRIRENVKVIVVSGYAEAEAMRKFAGRNIAGFLQKPFTASVLAEKVGLVLRASRTAAG